MTGVMLNMTEDQLTSLWYRALLLMLEKVWLSFKRLHGCSWCARCVGFLKGSFWTLPKKKNTLQLDLLRYSIKRLSCIKEGWRLKGYLAWFPSGKSVIILVFGKRKWLSRHHYSSAGQISPEIVNHIVSFALLSCQPLLRD